MAEKSDLRHDRFVLNRMREHWRDEVICQVRDGQCKMHIYTPKEYYWVPIYELPR